MSHGLLLDMWVPVLGIHSFVCQTGSSVARCNLAWHDLSPVNISVVLNTICIFISRIDVIFGILVLGTPHHEEES